MSGNENRFNCSKYKGETMFLNRLSASEKVAFISLSIYAARANDIISEREYSILEEYYKETGVTFYDIANIKPIEEVYEVFSNSDYSTKKAVLFELLNLLYADGSYDTLEKDFLEKFAISIGLSNEDLDQIIDLVWKYIDVINKIADVITLSDNS